MGGFREEEFDEEEELFFLFVAGVLESMVGPLAAAEDTDNDISDDEDMLENLSRILVN